MPTRLLYTGLSATDPAAGAVLAETDPIQRPGLYTVNLTVSSSALPMDVLLQVRRAGVTLSTLVMRFTISPFIDDMESYILATGDIVRVVNRNAIVGEVNVRIGLR